MTKEEAKAKLDELVATLQAGINAADALCQQHSLNYSLTSRQSVYGSVYVAHLDVGGGGIDAWVSSSYEETDYNDPDWISSDC